MQRAITDFRCDEAGEWVALLECGHRQHVRHRPPFQLREWILTPSGRSSRLGSPLSCPLCDRAEMPDDLRWVRTTPVWDEHTLPAALRRAHRLAPGTWGRLVVSEGRVRFVGTTPLIDVDLGAGSTQDIPPETTHHLELHGSVRLSIEFFRVESIGRDPSDGEDEQPTDEPV